MAATTFLKLTAIYLISSTTVRVAALSSSSSSSSSAFEAFDLSARANNECAISTYSACNVKGLPGNFCCPADDSCYVFNDQKSVICCPQGKDCSSVSTISCDLSLQNVALHPDSPLFTTQLDATMQQCGNSCCPIGMFCQDGKQCIDSNKAAAASSSAVASSAAATSAAATSTAAVTSSSAPTTSPSSTSTTTSTAPNSSASGALSTQTPTSATHCNQFPTTGILVGFFSGLTAGILLTVLMVCCVGRKREQTYTDKYHSDFSSVTANVSDPIYDPGNERADFLRRDSRSKVSSTLARGTSSRMRSLFTRTPTMLSRRNSPTQGSPRTPMPTRNLTQRSKRTNTTISSSSQSNTLHNPRTPKTPSSLKKEPSMESIKIYSPPNIAGALHEERMTTFRDMMAEAGLKDGAPYLGSPGRVDPRSRRIGDV